jgi:hypothetical protein
MDLKNTGWDSMDWIHLALDREWWWALVNFVIRFKSIKY